MSTKVTAKEELFCQYYIKSLNKSQAAIKAGYSKRSAKEIGYALFTKIHIQHRIAEIREEIKEQLGIDDHTVITELAELSFWNIKDFVKEGNVIKDISKMNKQKLKPITGIKVREIITTMGGVTTKEITTELKMTDKRAAVIDLGRHLGIFEKDNKQKAMKIKVTRK